MGIGACIGCLRAAEDLREAQARLLAVQAELKTTREQLAEVNKLSELQAADLERLKLELRKAKEGHNQPERVAEDQLQLAFERVVAGLSEEQKAAAEAANAAANDEQAAPSKKPRNRGRRRLAQEPLSVIEQREVPPEVLAAEGQGWRYTGDEVSERIAHQPARYVRLRLIREKWVRCDDHGRWLGTPVTAPLPSWVLPGLMADTSVIASILVGKYGFALPLNRQEQMIGLDGFPIARSTMSDWTAAAFALARPVVSAMHAESLAESYQIATDATGAPVRALGGRIHHHLFVFIADAGHITFIPTRRHDGLAIKSMLGDFRGALLSDAAGIYNVVHTLGVLFVACWAHVRRYFWKATLTEPELAYEALSIIQNIFLNERRVKRLPQDQRADFRREKTLPLIEAMDTWAETAATRADTSGRIVTALGYYANQREALGRFIEDGRLEADNNSCERQLRAHVVGLKNWMHFENKTGLEWYATFRSLIASCRLYDLNPTAYLEQMLRLARHWPDERKLELSPKYWRSTVQGLEPSQQAIIHPPWKSQQPRPPPLIAAAS